VTDPDLSVVRDLGEGCAGRSDPCNHERSVRNDLQIARALLVDGLTGAAVGEAGGGNEVDGLGEARAGVRGGEPGEL